MGCLNSRYLVSYEISGEKIREPTSVFVKKLIDKKRYYGSEFVRSIRDQKIKLYDLKRKRVTKLGTVEFLARMLNSFKDVSNTPSVLSNTGYQISYCDDHTSHVENFEEYLRQLMDQDNDYAFAKLSNSQPLILIRPGKNNVQFYPAELYVRWFNSSGHFRRLVYALEMLNYHIKTRI